MTAAMKENDPDCPSCTCAGGGGTLVNLCVKVIACYRNTSTGVTVVVKTAGGTTVCTATTITGSAGSYCCLVPALADADPGYTVTATSTVTGGTATATGVRPAGPSPTLDVTGPPTACSPCVPTVFEPALPTTLFLTDSQGTVTLHNTGGTVYSGCRSWTTTGHTQNATSIACEPVSATTGGLAYQISCGDFDNLGNGGWRLTANWRGSGGPPQGATFDFSNGVCSGPFANTVGFPPGGACGTLYSTAANLSGTIYPYSLTGTIGLPVGGSLTPTMVTITQ